MTPEFAYIIALLGFIIISIALSVYVYNTAKYHSDMRIKKEREEKKKQELEEVRLNLMYEDYQRLKRAEEKEKQLLSQHGIKDTRNTNNSK